MMQVQFYPRKTNRVARFFHEVRRHGIFYLFLLPGVIYLILFCYWPMFGIQIAFRNFKFADGISGSKWVGLKWFKDFLSSPKFSVVLRNTLRISLYSIAVGFPIPIVFALLLNYIPNKSFKKVSQTITFMPHFISVVIFVNMLNVFLSPTSGFVNTIIQTLGGEPIYFFGKPQYYIHLYIWSGIWQETGWNAIIYVAALAGVDPGLHEAAKIDGANKIQRMWHVDIPCLFPTMVILLILRCGSIMNLGFEKSYMMQNAVNLDVSEVISTYVYKIGIQKARYSSASAIGLFQNLINIILLVVMNFISKKLSDTSLW
jgi:putative aldouronate transport system permease protein